MTLSLDSVNFIKHVDMSRSRWNWCINSALPIFACAQDKTISREPPSILSEG